MGAKAGVTEAATRPAMMMENSPSRETSVTRARHPKTVEQQVERADWRLPAQICQDGAELE